MVSGGAFQEGLGVCPLTQGKGAMRAYGVFRVTEACRARTKTAGPRRPALIDTLKQSFSR